MFNKQTLIVNFLLLTFILLTGCNLSAETTLSSKKVFELDLTDQGISEEGGGIELVKHVDGCLLILSIYREAGQEKYKFNFKKNKLLSTDYLKYRYKNGLIVADDDLRDLIADYQEKNSNADMNLVLNKSFTGNENKNITKKFKIYKRKVPQKVLNDYCR
ncbi:hypothetical protein [Acinetobacter sp. ANC 3813]|uniref:hypothetical protein n=1 Tax=Acinetobacter sp. ANC 3813 TaxID=1977873 RepID=UPI000A32F9BB|nr:hypothetical protein [Acinetobacter sp. ANC 3813]